MQTDGTKLPAEKANGNGHTEKPAPLKEPGTIVVRDLHVSYRDHEVLRGVDLQFMPGKVTAIIGPSGCGKTTLLRSLNRLSDVTDGCHVKGEALLDGENIYRMDPVLLRRRVGMVFQKPNPFPMSIKENVVYGVKAQAKYKGSYLALVKSCLETSILWEEVKDRLDRSALNLSLGQQQRLCIARALAVSPEVLLMDEPAASLDPVSTGRLEESILAMKGKYTVIIVTHDVREAREVSDFTAFLHEGRLVEFGETRQIFESPANELTKEYVGGRLIGVSPTLEATAS
jgi:phosphate transport system ATP-binding protein